MTPDDGQDTAPDLEIVRSAVAGAGFVLRGVFHCVPEDAVPGAGGASAGSLALVGSVGEHGFRAFRDSAFHGAAHPDPLDAFTEHVVEPLAASLGARALYPHRGPQWLPFQRWAARAEPVHPSPLGILVHPHHGLWHAYRAALVFTGRVPGVGVPAPRPSPCAGCAARPCLHACPVDAFGAHGFDADACAAHLDSGRGSDCVEGGCRARRACPVAPQLRYRVEQARFHMAAFARACRRERGPA